jgi:hypothetical protein
VLKKLLHDIFIGPAWWTIALAVIGIVLGAYTLIREIVRQEG